MATVTRRETVCNVGFTRCKNDDLEFYEIRKDSHRPVKLALCVKHRKAIEQLLETAELDPHRRGVVLTVEQIEYLKRRGDL